MKHVALSLLLLAPFVPAAAATDATRPNIIFIMSDDHTAQAVGAKLRQDIGDDASHHPACEKVVQEFWDYDEADRTKAIEISHQYKAAREKPKKRGGK